MSAIAVVRSSTGGGLQERAATGRQTAVLEKVLTILSATSISGPSCQVGLLFVLPPIMLARVAVSLCPSFLLVHVALECPRLTLYPCVQQYPVGSREACGGRRVVGVAVCGVGAPFPRSVNAVVSAATLAVSEATLAVSVALFSMS